MTTDCIDIHTHIVPENFPAHAGEGRDREQERPERCAQARCFLKWATVRSHDSFAAASL